MEVKHRASAPSNSTTATTTFTITIPASIQAGDDLYCSVTSRDHTAGTALATCTDDDSGGNSWNLIQNSTDRKAYLFHKKATGATASKTITIAGAVGSASGLMNGYYGALSTGDPTTNISIETNASGNETHAGFVPTHARSMICLSVYNYANDNLSSNQSCSTPGTLVERGDSVSTGGSDCATSHASALQVGDPVTTGNITWAQTNGTTYSIVWAIQPDDVTPTVRYFDFTLASEAKTTAAVFDPDDRLVRTIWSNETFPAGTHIKTFDGLDDDGDGISFTPVIKVLSHNIDYEWEGVLGNTSDNFYGPTVIVQFRRFEGMAIDGTTAYYCVGFGEGGTPTNKLDTSTPQQRDGILVTRSGIDLSANFVCTDGTNVFWAGYDSETGDQDHWIFKTSCSTDLETSFTVAGSSESTLHGRTYSSCIDVQRSDVNQIHSGLAVQQSGNFLFAAHEVMDELRVFHKGTGATVQTLTHTAVRHICLESDTELWMVTGSNTVAKYTVNGDGTLTAATLTLSTGAPVKALGLGCDAANGLLLVVDGDSSQQIKAYDTTTGALTWTLGTAGGYATDPAITDTKFYFDDPTKRFLLEVSSDRAWITVDPADSSFWFGDHGNNRVMHFDSSQTLIEKIESSPHTYATEVCIGDNTRIFNENIEYERDYGITLGPNNGSWVAVRNWRYGMNLDHWPGTYGVVIPFRNVVTLSNGKTYALQFKNDDAVISGNIFCDEVIELPSSGHLRYTGVFMEQFVTEVIQADGTRRRRNSTGDNPGDTTTIEELALTGFSSDNPTWGSPTTVVTFPPVNTNSPLYKQKSYPVKTSNGVHVVFSQEKENNGPHLGGFMDGDTDWMFKTCYGTTPWNAARPYSGPMPYDGRYDTGKDVSNPNGNVFVSDDNIFWNYRGEFWKSSQTNIWYHYLDNGMMVGMFGKTVPQAMNYDGYDAPREGAGNVLTGAVVKEGSDLYVYHGDEFNHSGTHSWKITNLSSLDIQTASIVGGPEPTVGTDLMSGLTFGSVLSTGGIFTRSHAEDSTSSNNYFNIWTSIKSHKEDKIDVFYQASKEADRFLDIAITPTGGISEWSVSGEINFDGNTPREDSDTRGLAVIFLDSSDNAIAEIYHKYDSSTGGHEEGFIESIVCNGTSIVDLRGLRMGRYTFHNTPFSIRATASGVDFSFGDETPLTGLSLADGSAVWDDIAKIRIQTIANNVGVERDRKVSLNSLLFEEQATGGAIDGDVTFTVNGTGSLTATGALAGSAPATIDGTGSLTATGVVAGADSFSVNAAGSLTAIGELVGNASLILNGTGVLDGSTPTTNVKQFNGVARGNIKKINGVLIANIKKINTVT